MWNVAAGRTMSSTALSSRASASRRLRFGQAHGGVARDGALADQDVCAVAIVPAEDVPAMEVERRVERLVRGVDGTHRFVEAIERVGEQIIGEGRPDLATRWEAGNERDG
jgi:hypothetical protein